MNFKFNLLKRVVSLLLAGGSKQPHQWGWVFWCSWSSSGQTGQNRGTSKQTNPAIRRLKCLFSASWLSCFVSSLSLRRRESRDPVRLPREMFIPALARTDSQTRLFKCLLQAAYTIPPSFISLLTCHVSHHPPFIMTLWPHNRPPLHRQS